MFQFPRGAIIILFFILSIPFSQMLAQEGVTIDVKKPPQFENKVLKSEKSGDKKFTLPRHLMQNTATHYNYYFNAKAKIDAIIERAVMGHRDDFTKLISFYPYLLDETATETAELDSVILKATAGILLHDLRNDWVDNLYLLIGRAYLLRKDFDSANLTFQYINYNFHESRKETDRVYIGSRTSDNTESINVATKEKGGIVRKVFALPPSRNDALLYQARNFMEMGDMIEASALLAILKTDKNFPPRLNPFYEELQAYWYYKQEQWDSAAVHLEQALDNANGKQDLARREFLLAQLYQRINQPQKASKYFNKAGNHTTNLLMAIHADLNEAQLVKGEGENNIQNTIKELLKMAGRGKYDAYRDLLYFSAATLQLKIKDTTAAITSFQKSIDKAIDPNYEYKNKSYLALSEIAFNQKNYQKAVACIDSLQLVDETLIDMLPDLERRKFVLHQIAEKNAVIEREDSLQKIALMPELERDAYIKKALKKLRKEKGLKDDEETAYVNPAVKGNNNVEDRDLFSDARNNINTTTGEWYFYNATTKSKGFTDFKSKWGKRANVDNWRRVAATDKATFITTKKGNDNENSLPGKTKDTATNALSYESLVASLPLKPEQVNTSNMAIRSALFDLGTLYKNVLEDYHTSIQTFEQLRNRFTNYEKEDEVLFNLYYCYLKIGNSEKSNYYKKLLAEKYANSQFNKYASNYVPGSAPEKDEITQAYEHVYDLMLAGKFEQAFSEKKEADGKYGENHWSPQLLYIEAIYHIKQKDDSVATATLGKILLLYPNSPLYQKAKTLKDVLSRRNEIENYLTNLQVTRAVEERVEIPYESNPLAVSAEAKKAEQKEKQQNDFTVKNKTSQPEKLNAPKVLPQGEEQKTAQQKQKEQVDFNVKEKPAIPGNLIAKKDTTIASKMALLKIYTFKPEEPHYVIMVLVNVDQIFVSESRNAFKRYNSFYHNNEVIDLSGFRLNDSTAVNVFSQFPDVLKATDYAMELKEKTSQIVPWLKGGKYYYLVISPENLSLLKERKDAEEYHRFLNLNMSDKF
ncbi:MAG TPA: hypothetical protein VFN30_12385 [Chitinophagaceae bacterium]|nr:hypothetical protein [Chitinophagaceae bacterium]